MKRVMIGGIMHETNTFNPELTTPKKFAQRALFHGDEMFDTLCDHTVIDTQSIKPHERVQRGAGLPRGLQAPGGQQPHPERHARLLLQ